MRFMYPLGLLGLIGVPVLVLIYILRSKYNEQTVASTYLWTLSEKFFKRRNLLSGITGIISLILQICMVVFLSLAIARPIFTIPDSASQYCFVLDGSGSMNTLSGLKTRFEKGKDYIEETISSARLGSSYTLVYLTNEGSVIYEQVTDKKLALSMLDDLSCTDSPAEDSDVLEIAQSYFDLDSSTLVYFVTDKDYEDSENVEIVNVSSQNVTNYAISDVVGDLTDGTLYTSGKVVSYTEDAKLKVELYVNDDTRPAETVSVSVIKGEPATVELSHRVDSYDSFRLVISNKDDLMADNEIVSYNLKSEESYSILIVSETPFFLQASLDALTDSVVDTLTPEEYVGQSGYGLYIFEGYTPDELPDASVWLINSTKSVANSGFGVRGVEGLSYPAEIEKSSSTSSKARKLLSGVVGKEIYVSEYVKYSGMYTQFTTLFSYESHPIVFAGVNALGNREVVFAFDIHKSDIAISTDFVPLVSNLLDYLCPAILDRAVYSCGEEAEVNITPNVDSVKTIAPDGEESYIDTATDIGIIPLDQVGTYTVRVSISGEEKIYKIFSMSSAEEGDPNVQGQSFSLVGEQTYEKTDGEYDPLVLLFVLLAVVFSADWMVYCYEKYQLR